MPARLAIQASRVHNAWLCLIWIVLFFRPRAKKAMRSGNATTMAASRHPDHRPLVTPASPEPCGFPACVWVLVLPAGCAWRRARLTVYALRTAFAEYRRFPAVGFAVRFAKRPAEKCK